MSMSLVFVFGLLLALILAQSMALVHWKSRAEINEELVIVFRERVFALEKELGILPPEPRDEN